MASSMELVRDFANVNGKVIVVVEVYGLVVLYGSMLIDRIVAIHNIDLV
jgi:hypothetical protein